MSQKEVKFENLFESHFKDLYKLAVWLCHNPNEAEDLVQETALRAFRSFDRFRKDAPFKPWVFTILTNVFKDSRRRKKHKGISTDFKTIEPALDNETSVQFEATNIDDFGDFVDDEIKQAVQEMPENYRLVFLLHSLAELSYEEIANTLGCPIGTVMSRLYRARGILRNSLKSYRPSSS